MLMAARYHLPARDMLDLSPGGVHLSGACAMVLRGQKDSFHAI
jgi:hypothetical protein